MLTTYLKTRAQSTSWPNFKTRSQIAWRISWRRSSAERRSVTISFLARTGTSTLLLIHFPLGSPLSPVNSLLVVGVRSELIRQVFVDGRPSKLTLVGEFNCFNTLWDQFGTWFKGDFYFFVRFVFESPTLFQTCYLQSLHYYRNPTYETGPKQMLFWKSFSKRRTVKIIGLK